MRCDLHVHSRYSGSADLPLIRHLSRECYSDPHDVYRVAKARGMDLVTITDHDTIEGALELADLPDFIVGEELTCEIAPGRQIHLGLWDLSERTHHGLTQRRCDPEALFAFLAENDIPACINHPFSPLTGAREADDLHRAFAAISAIETQNGMMPKVSNEYARSEARRRRLAQVGGSDAHTLDRIGHAFTTVPRADNREEFLAGLRDGFTVPAGGAGTYARLTADVIRIFSGAVVENTVQALQSPLHAAKFLATTSIVPFFSVIPLVTFASYFHEYWAGRAIHSDYRDSLPLARPERAPLLSSGLAAGGER